MAATVTLVVALIAIGVFMLSVAVSVCWPPVVKLTFAVATPFWKVTVAGTFAAESEDVNLTVPE